MISKQKSLAVESGAIFVEIAAEHIVDGAVKFADQIVDAKPLSAGEDAPILQVCPEDVNGVLEWCVENTESGFSGHESPDLRALITLAKRLDRVDLFADLLVSHAEVEDAINTYEEVIESAVVGYPHEIKGQGIYAFIICNGEVENEEVLKAAVITQVTQIIGSIAKPDKIQVVSGLPKTRSGKIMRRILRKVASRDASNLGAVSYTHLTLPTKA